MNFISFFYPPCLRGDPVRFSAGNRVRLNTRGKNSNLSILATDTWSIVDVKPATGMDGKPSNAHPDLCYLDPPHPFGPISGMFLEHDTWWARKQKVRHR